jgi:hypothetical protein
MRYLFPCRCGQKHPVETRQAGQTIRCSCGVRLEVPTLRKILLLEKEVTHPQPQRPSRGGLKYRLMMLGLVVLLLSIGLGAFIWTQWPSPPTRTYDAVSIHQETMSLTPLQSLQAWEMLLHSPLGKLRSQGPSPTMIVAYQQRRAELESLGVIAAVVGVVALGLLVGASMMPKPRRAG